MTTTLEAPANMAGDVYREALEKVYRGHRDFTGFLRARAALHYRNAAAHEAQTGKLSHKDRSAASEVEYLIQQFERKFG